MQKNIFLKDDLISVVVLQLVQILRAIAMACMCNSATLEAEF